MYFCWTMRNVSRIPMLTVTAFLPSHWDSFDQLKWSLSTDFETAAQLLWLSFLLQSESSLNFITFFRALADVSGGCYLDHFVLLGSF